MFPDSCGMTLGCKIPISSIWPCHGLIRYNTVWILRSYGTHIMCSCLPFVKLGSRYKQDLPGHLQWELREYHFHKRWTMHLLQLVSKVDTMVCEWTSVRRSHPVVCTRARDAFLLCMSCAASECTCTMSKAA